MAFTPEQRASADWGLTLGETIVREQPRSRPDALLEALMSLDVDGLVYFDRRGRHRLPYIAPERVPELIGAFHTSRRWAVAAVLSVHGSGYVRERAVQQLALTSGPEAIPFLLLRMNDWVASVRDIATSALAERVTVEHAAAFMHHTLLVRRARRWNRADHGRVLRSIAGLLASPAAETARWEALHHAEPSVRRAAFVRSLAADPGRIDELIALADQNPDRAIRRRVVEHLRRLETSSLAARTRPFLLDVDGVIRSIAQNLSRRAEPTFELASYYRRQLEAGSDLRAALYGLGETGALVDAERAIAFLHHEHTVVRRAALYAITGLDAEGQAAHLVAALANERLRVARDAAKWLGRYAHVIDAHRPGIEAIARVGPRPEHRHLAALVLEAGEAYRQEWS